MKLLAIVGTNADFSYNRFLDQFMAKRYKDQAEIEVYEIADLPRFKKEAQPDSKVEEFKNKISTSVFVKVLHFCRYYCKIYPMREVIPAPHFWVGPSFLFFLQNGYHIFISFQAAAVFSHPPGKTPSAEKFLPADAAQLTTSSILTADNLPELP